MENNNIVNDIERIVKENKVQVIESNGRTFATKSLVEIEPRKDIAAEIRFSDLSSELHSLTVMCERVSWSLGTVFSMSLKSMW